MVGIYRVPGYVHFKKRWLLIFLADFYSWHVDIEERMLLYLSKSFMLYCCQNSSDKDIKELKDKFLRGKCPNLVCLRFSDLIMLNVHGVP